jgi:hypothetical protein
MSRTADGRPLMADRRPRTDDRSSPGSDALRRYLFRRSAPSLKTIPLVATLCVATRSGAPRLHQSLMEKL